MTSHAKHHDTSPFSGGAAAPPARADGDVDPDAWAASPPAARFTLRLPSARSLVVVAVPLGAALVGLGIVPVSLAATWLLVGGCLLMHAFMGHGRHAGHGVHVDSAGRDRDGSDSQRGIS